MRRARPSGAGKLILTTGTMMSDLCFIYRFFLLQTFRSKSGNIDGGKGLMNAGSIWLQPRATDSVHVAKSWWKMGSNVLIQTSDAQ